MYIHDDDGAGDIWFVEPSDAHRDPRRKTLKLIDSSGAEYRGRVFVDRDGRIESMEIYGGPDSATISKESAPLRMPRTWETE